jgi:hypothetical protein
MRKIVILIILFAFYLQANSTLNYLNYQRKKSGLAPLKFNYTLKKAALHHAKYLALNDALSHDESPYLKAFYAKYPWDRVIKAGFPTRVVVENISFYEKNYKASIDKLMGTVYHRLAFLDFRVDSIGFAKYNSRYVYEMSNSKIASICKKSFHAEFGVEGLCRDRSKILEQRVYNKTILSTLAKSKRVSFYPYRNQKNVPTHLVEERPIFLYGEYGFPITVRFNNYYINKVRLKKFALYENNHKVPTKIVHQGNDLEQKLDEHTFVLVPLNPLKRKTKYKVVLQVKEDKRVKNYSWSFRTR